MGPVASATFMPYCMRPVEVTSMKRRCKALFPCYKKQVASIFTRGVPPVLAMHLRLGCRDEYDKGALEKPAKHEPR